MQQNKIKQHGIVTPRISALCARFQNAHKAVSLQSHGPLVVLPINSTLHSPLPTSPLQEKSPFKTSDHWRACGQVCLKKSQLGESRKGFLLVFRVLNIRRARFRFIFQAIRLSYLLTKFINNKLPRRLKMHAENSYANYHTVTSLLLVVIVHYMAITDYCILCLFSLQSY